MLSLRHLFLVVSQHCFESRHFVACFKLYLEIGEYLGCRNFFFHTVQTFPRIHFSFHVENKYKNVPIYCTLVVPEVFLIR